MSSKKTKITDEEIQRALKKFEEKGGLIKRLPDQVAPSGNQVGGKFAMFETVGDGQYQVDAG